MWVSHEAIYQYIYDSKNPDRKEFYIHCRLQIRTGNVPQKKELAVQQSFFLFQLTGVHCGASNNFGSNIFNLIFQLPASFPALWKQRLNRSESSIKFIHFDIKLNNLSCVYCYRFIFFPDSSVIVS